MTDNVRIERDFLGEIKIPADALYGAQTARGVDNFAVSGRSLGTEPEFLRAFVLVKMAAALANRDLGVLDEEQASALVRACREVIDGLHREQFIVDLFEGSGGTSLNMNVNEVLANRALILMGASPGEYSRLHPNDHVNRSQSTNDVLPSAIKIACYEMIGELGEALGALRDAFAAKSAEFAEVLRLGRTCLQDAQPMTLGQAFGGYAALTERLATEIMRHRDEMLTLPLGGTAIGTGLGAPPGYRQRVYEHLSELTGIMWRMPADAFDAMQNADGFARLSAEIRTSALSLAKIAADLIVLSSGPAGGVGELRLPALQAGSSIMPGKVNPVQPMMLMQIGFAVAGNDTCVSMASQQGQLEINAFEPAIAYGLFASLRMLASGVRKFTERCIMGIRADAERSMRNLVESSAIATAIVPRLGYDVVADLVRKGAREGKSFLVVAEETGKLPRDEAIALIRQTAVPPE